MICIHNLLKKKSENRSPQKKKKKDLLEPLLVFHNLSYGTKFFKNFLKNVRVMEKIKPVKKKS